MAEDLMSGRRHEAVADLLRISGLESWIPGLIHQDSPALARQILVN